MYLAFPGVFFLFFFGASSYYPLVDILFAFLLFECFCLQDINNNEYSPNPHLPPHDERNGPCKVLLDYALEDNSARQSRHIRVTLKDHKDTDQEKEKERYRGGVLFEGKDIPVFPSALTSGCNRKVL